MIQNLVKTGDGAIAPFMNIYPTPECPLKLFGPDYKKTAGGITIEKSGNMYHVTGARSGASYNFSLMNVSKTHGLGSELNNMDDKDLPITNLRAGDTYRISIHIVDVASGSSSWTSGVRFVKADTDFQNAEYATDINNDTITVKIRNKDIAVDFIAESGKRYGFFYGDPYPGEVNQIFTITLSRVSPA